MLSLMLVLTVSFHSTPYYTGADIVFVFAWTPLVLAGSDPVLSADAALSPPGKVATDMELVQSRIVTDNIERLAAFYAQLAGVPMALNEYNVEVHAGPTSVGLSKRRFTEYHRCGKRRSRRRRARPQARDHSRFPCRRYLDAAAYKRIKALGVQWLPRGEGVQGHAVMLPEPVKGALRIGRATI